MKTSTGKGQEAFQSAELTKKGGLTPAEEALLKEMIQNNGSLAAQKKAAKMTGFVNGEPLNRREGIGAVKSMTAKEGEILKNLSGGEATEAPKKFRAGKSAGPKHLSVPREAPENEGRAAQATPFAETVKQELAGLFDALILPIGQVLGQNDELPHCSFVLADIHPLRIAPIALFFLLGQDLGNDALYHDVTPGFHYIRVAGRFFQYVN